MQTLLTAMKEAALHLKGDCFENKEMDTAFSIAHMLSLMNEVINNTDQPLSTELAEQGVLAKLNEFRLQTLGVLGITCLFEKNTTKNAQSHLKAISNSWSISLHFGCDALRQGVEPSSFIKCLKEMGEITELSIVTDNIPDLQTIDAECCYISLEVSFESTKTKTQLASVFEFVQQDCAIRITPSDKAIDYCVDLIRALPEKDALLGEILVKSNVLTSKELNRALYIQKSKENTGQKETLGEILVALGSIDLQLIDAAAGKQSAVRNKKNKIESHLAGIRLTELEQLIITLDKLLQHPEKNKRQPSIAK